MQSGRRIPPACAATKSTLLPAVHADTIFTLVAKKHKASAFVAKALAWKA